MEYFPQFFDVSSSAVAQSQLSYSQIYINDHVIELDDFQVHGGYLNISDFGREEFRCLSIFLMMVAHSTSDGKCISFHLLYYVDSLL